MFSYFNLVRKNIKHNKIKRREIIILTMSLLLVMIVFSFKFSINEYINDGIKNDIAYRTLFIDINPYVFTDSEEVVDLLKDINHVDDAFSNEYYSTVLYIEQLGNVKMNQHSNSFFIIGVNENTLPVVKYGRKIENDNEIICPINFYPSDNIDDIKKIKRDSIIKMTKYLNSDIKAEYYIYEMDGESIEEKINLKLVGIYENNYSYIDENVCYASRNLIKEIYNTAYQNIDFSGIYSSINIQVDSISNIDYVRSKVESLGYNVSQALSLKENFINSIIIGSYLIVIFIILFNVIIINYLNKKQNKEKQREISILLSLGFSKKDVRKLNFLENLYISLISIVISLVIFGFIFILFKIFVYYNPFIFQKIPIKFNLVSIFIVLIILFVANVVNLKHLNKKILCKSIINIMKD